MRIPTLLALTSALVTVSSLPTLAQTGPLILTQTQPNLRLSVTRQSGNCPTSVGLWAVMVPLEGGADHAVVADIGAIAGRAQLTTANKRSAEYSAPLKPAYASCVGRAVNPQASRYTLQFRDSKVYFRVNAGNSPNQILSSYLTAGRPYVFWQARE